MTPQYSHKVSTSFRLWIDNYLLTKGLAYTNVSGHDLTYVADPKLPTKSTFGSAYKQWVYDSSVPGAIVVNYVSGAGYATLDRQSQIDLKIDYDNGRVIFDNDNPVIVQGSPLQGYFAVKDFNIYPTDLDEETLITETNYKMNARYSSLTDSTLVDPYNPVTPAIFVALNDSHNTPIALGGLNETDNDVRCVVFAESDYHLDGVLSIFRDSRDEVISLLEFGDDPRTAYGDLKTGDSSYNLSDVHGNPYFNYTGLAATKTEKIFVKEVFTSKMSAKLRDKINPTLHIGFLDFTLSNYRNPRN